MSEVRLIDANKLILKLWGERSTYEDWDSGKDIYVSLAEIHNVAESLPTVDAEPVRHGYWIEHTSWYWTQECECSECGNIEGGFNYPYETEKAVDHAGLYCRRCGAKMDKVTE